MIAIGSDHGGFALKQQIMAYLKKRGLEYKDFGTYSEESCDYPVYGKAVAKAVAAYNAGRGNVLSWMKQYGWDYRFNNPEEIPYRETQEYVKSVLGNRNKYQKLYEVQEQNLLKGKGLGYAGEYSGEGKKKIYAGLCGL